jgi:hypothetical protein
MLSQLIARVARQLFPEAKRLRLNAEILRRHLGEFV